MLITKRKFLAVTAAGFYASTLPTLSWAHRAARTETEVTLYDDGRIDVIHLMHTDDTKRALFDVGILDKPDLLGLKARAKVALYVESHFSIFANDTPVELEVIGAEIEGPNFYVYQQGHTDAPAKDISLEASMMRELIHSQTNSVNIKHGGETYSLDFRGRDGRKHIIS